MQGAERVGHDGTRLRYRGLFAAAIVMVVATLALTLVASDANAARKGVISLGSVDAWETSFGGEDSTMAGYSAAGSDKGVTSIHTIGDFNADGFEDYAVGRAQAHDDDGEVWLIYGRAKFPAKRYTANNSLPEGIATRITTTDGNSYLGASVSGGFDINGDQIDDMVMGAPNGGPSNDGAAYVVYGRPNPPRAITITYGASIPVFGGLNLVPSIGGDSDAESDDFGAQVAMGAAPQYTIDTSYESHSGTNPRWNGRGAVAISDPGNDNTLDSCDGPVGYDCGTVWWFTHFPYAADSVGPWSDARGTTYTMGLPAADAQEDGMWYYGCRVDGAGYSDDFGTSLDLGPDATGDGAPDMIVGAPDAEGSDGAAYVISGEGCMHRRAQARWADCDYAESFQGCGVIGAGKIDDAGGDNDKGFRLHSMDDGSNDNFGQTVAILDSGTRSGTDADAQALESQPGDMSGDHISEVAAGDTGSDLSRTDAGAVWVFPGQSPMTASPGTWPTSAGPGRGFKIEGARADDEFATFLSAAGDLDADGLPDLMASAPNTDYATVTQPDGAFTVDIGSEYVIYGQDLRASTGVAHSVDLARESSDWTRIDMAGGVYASPIWGHPASSDGDGGDGSPAAVGDFNGNGTDLEGLVTAPGEDADGLTDAGAWYQLDKLGTSRGGSDLTDGSSKGSHAACGAAPSELESSPDCPSPPSSNGGVRRCNAVLSKRVRSRAGLKVKGVGRTVLFGPRSVRSTSRTQAGIFSVGPTSQRRANPLKGKLKVVTFKARLVPNKKAAKKSKKAKFKTLGKDRKAPFVLDLKRKLAPGKYEQRAVVKPAHGKVKTLKLNFTVVGNC